MQRITGANRPRGALLIPTQKQGEAPPASVRSAGLWSSQQMSVVGPAGSWAGRQGHCPWAGPAPAPAEHAVKTPSSPATDPTVSLPALCRTLSPQEPLGPSWSQLLPLPSPPSVNIQDLSGQLGPAPSDDVGSRHQRLGPFSREVRPAGRPLVLGRGQSWVRCSHPAPRFPIHLPLKSCPRDTAE